MAFADGPDHVRRLAAPHAALSPNQAQGSRNGFHTCCNVRTLTVGRDLVAALTAGYNA